MIKIKNIHKYFNKNKNNEIHVIDDTSIDFPKTGLVAITGPSGCGKTTLLNVIAGLDSFKSGEITYDDVTVNKYKASLIDQIRNQKIGFIFQNYHLLPDQSVYDNIKTSLNIAGLYDKDDLDARIHYSLEQVGMFNYRKRNVLALSGGQQQRVGIARAIAKNPEVILADEPTGNLDSNNTFEIMSLIKNISKTKLVILVTHEKHLVDYFADRIIELKDGKVVNDYNNFKDSSFSHKDERLIYLKDLQKEDLETKFIDYYYEKESHKNFDFKIVETNNTIYIQTNSEKKVQFIDDESEVQLIDDHKKEFKTEDLEPLDFDKFHPIDTHHKKSLFRWRDTLMTGLKKMFSRKKFSRKLTIFVYFVISAIIALEIAFLGGLIKVDEANFLSAPKSFIALETESELTYNELKDINDIQGVESTYFRSVNSEFYREFYYQSSVNFYDYYATYPIKASWVDAPMLSGRLPETIDEVAVSMQSAMNMLSMSNAYEMGIEGPEDLVGFTMSLPLRNKYDETFEATVVGVVDTQEAFVAYSEEGYYYLNQINVNHSSLSVYEDDLTLTEGRLPNQADEIIIGQAYSQFSVGQSLEIFDKTYSIVGKFDLLDDSILSPGVFLFQDQEFEENLYNNNIRSSTFDGYRYLFHADDKEAALSALEDMDYEVYDIYQQDYDNFIENRNLSITGRLTTLLVTFIGIVLFIYFLMRTSMINRIKEVGIYRAIGASRKDLYKIFLSEILVYTTILSAAGYLISSYVLVRVNEQIESISFQTSSVFHLPFWLLIAGLLLIYLVNIFFGLLPIFSLLRKSPAEILAKYDI